MFGSGQTLLDMKKDTNIHRDSVIYKTVATNTLTTTLISFDLKTPVRSALFIGRTVKEKQDMCGLLDLCNKDCSLRCIHATYQGHSWLWKCTQDQA